jgi:NADH:ubiquinone oxidoreductase subunit K
MPQASWYFALSAILFAIGLFGVFTRRNAIGIMMCIELMLNAANINLVALSSYRGIAAGQVFAVFVMTIAAAEVAVGLAIVICLYRNFRDIKVDNINLMKW